MVGLGLLLLSQLTLTHAAGLVLGSRVTVALRAPSILRTKVRPPSRRRLPLPLFPCFLPLSHRSLPLSLPLSLARALSYRFFLLLLEKDEKTGRGQKLLPPWRVERALIRKIAEGPGIQLAMQLCGGETI